MEIYNEKYLKGTTLAADFLLHIGGYFIVYNIWYLRCSRVVLCIFLTRS